ncbi:MAG: KEOPS complex subunit Cgi121 [Candidatus Methanomethylophilaceae archaeon]
MARYQLMGAKGDLDDIEALLQRLSVLPGETLVLRARRIMGKQHVESAVMHAQRAFERGIQSAHSLGVETMLYLSGERQISRAISELGLQEGDEEFAVITFGAEAETVIASMGWIRDDSVLDLNREKRIRIHRNEAIDGLPAEGLALERVALLDINR